MQFVIPRHAVELLRQALAVPDAEFRPGQWEAIQGIVDGRKRLLVVQRTGWGKSLVYFLATRFIREQGRGFTLIISPLLSLMRNQILAAERLGLVARMVSSDDSRDDGAVRQQHADVFEAAIAGKVDVLYITPERLANSDFRDRYALRLGQGVGLFVVDEAHCISDWGHDFRLDYQRIGRMLPLFPANIPVLATTATANNRVVKDVEGQLGDDVLTLRGPLRRDSLRLQNLDMPSPAARMAWLAEHLPGLPGSGIVYALTVKDAERVADWLQARCIDARAYHSELPREAKEGLEEALLANRVKTLVATTALGMGFDKPDLGFVIHFQRPGSVVHYYQQVGRAGRAVSEALGLLLCGEEDDEIADYFIASAFPSEAHVEAILAELETTPKGLISPDLETRLNLSKGRIEKALKYLEIKMPAPVRKEKSRWILNPVKYVPDRTKVEHLTALRKQEQAVMQAYMAADSCLMEFLCRELDDPSAKPCGRCEPCTGKPLVPATASMAVINEAVLFLKRGDHEMPPRKRWQADPLPDLGIKHTIPESLRAEVGRALATWGDAGWGELIKRGKQHAGRFDESLVEGAAALKDDLLADLDPGRIERLLGRGAAMAMAIDQWESGGLWVVSRSDPEYPRLLKARLNQAAPPLLGGRRGPHAPVCRWCRDRRLQGRRRGRHGVHPAPGRTLRRRGHRRHIRRRPGGR